VRHDYLLVLIVIQHEILGYLFSSEKVFNLPIYH
jgi:hypothetical protein